MHGQRSKTLWIGASLIVLLGGIAFAETHHKLPMFRLLTFLQLFLLFAMLTIGCRGRLQSATLVVATLAFGLVGAEAAGNWVLSRRGAETTAKDRVPVAEGPAQATRPHAEPAGDPNRSRGAQSSPNDKARTDSSYAEKPQLEIKQSAERRPAGPLVDANLFAPMAGIGWRLARAGDVHVIKVDPATGRTIYDVHYTIDANLDRETLSSRDGAAVAFLGDSLTFGSGVDDLQTMPQRFADLLDRKQRVVNLGVPGYSPAQVLYQLQNATKSKIIGPKPASLVMLTGPHHASRIACKDVFTNPAPRYAKEGGRIAYKGPCYAGVRLMWREFLDNSASYRAFVAPLVRGVNQADLDLYADLVAEVSATAQKAYGIKPLVPFVRSSPGGHVGVLEKLIAKGVDAIDVSLEADAASGKRLVIPGDGHPTAYAHDARAKMIKHALEHRGVRFAGMADAP